MKPRHWLWIFLGVLTLARLAMIGSSELSPDESYYFMWSQRPALAYYSKGPGVAVAIRASTAMFGATEFGVRFFAPLLALGTSLVLFALARRLYSESVAVWTVLLMNCIPIFNVGGLVMTIDPLSIFFWAAALGAFWMALEKPGEFSWWWPFSGLLIGLGFLAKYTNAMQLLSVVLVLATTRKFRREFSLPGFYTLLGAFAVCTVPVIVWNQQHAWITLEHLRARGGLDTAYAVHPGQFFEFLGAHFGVYSPLIFGALMLALWWARPLAATHFKPRFLVIFSVPLLVMYFVLSVKQAGEANWTAPAFVSLGILAAALWHERARTSAGMARFAVAALATGLVMSAIIANTDTLRVLGLRYGYARDPSARLRGWRTSAEAVGEFRKNFERATGQPVFLIANKYQTAASLAFYLPDKTRVEGAGHPLVYIPESQNLENEFSFWPRYDEFADLRQLAQDFLRTPDPSGAQAAVRKSLADALAALPEVEQENATGEPWRRFTAALHAAQPQLPLEDFYSAEGVSFFTGHTALYVTDRPEERPAGSIGRAFERVEMAGLLRISRRGLPLRELRIFACYNYRSLSL